MGNLKNSTSNLINNDMSTLNFNSRKSVSDDLNKYCIFAKDDDFIEVTQWTNGEGWDITINDKRIYLTDGELKAINHLVNSLDYSYPDNK